MDGVIVETELAQKLFQNLGDRGGPKHTVRYVAVPGSGATRWLLPTEPKLQAQVLRSWTPYRLASRIGWAVVRTASQFGHLAALPGVAAIETTGTNEASWRSLGWRWYGAPIPIVYIGTPGPTRKAVVHLVERETEMCRAVVKVPLTEAARIAVLHEAEVLQTLQEELREGAPQVLHLDRRGGVVTQTFVEGRPGARKLELAHWRLLRSLTLPGETTTIEMRARGWRRQIDGTAVPQIVKTTFSDLCDDEPIPVCWEHGDFAPWNIRRLADRRLALLDWEEANRGGLPLCDAFHFLHIQDFLFGKPPRFHHMDVRQEAETLGLPARMVAMLEMAYLVGAFVKCVERKNAERANFIACTLAKFERRSGQ